MLSVLICWLPVSIFAFLFGFALLHPICTKLKYTVCHISSYLAAGLVILTVYAEIFSLFYKVAALAFLLPVPFALFIAVWFFKDIRNTFIRLRPALPSLIALIIGILLFSFASSRGYMHYDTALYHSQFIRWIEEYGVVKGLALFHFRFGYNSAAYPLSALFSFSWMNLQPMHCMAGYFLLLLFMPVTGLAHIVKDRRIHFTDFVRIGMFYYITLVLFEIVSPASDYFATSVVFFVVYHYSLLAEKEEKSPVPFAFLSLLALYAVTLKLSAGFMAFLFIKPAYDLIKKKQFKGTGFFVLFGFVILMPMLIRGYIISGWPLYPSTLFGFLHPDWQIAAEIAHRDSAEIKAWGQKLPELGNYSASFSEWFPYWFKTESILNRLFFIADLIGIVCTFTVFPFFAFRKKTERESSGSSLKASSKKKDFLLLLILLSASFFLWFTAAPLVRYGYAFVILPCLLAAGFTYTEILYPVLLRKSSHGKNTRAGRFLLADYILLVFFAAVILYKGVMLCKEMKNYLPMNYYVCAMPYEEYETESYTVSGITFYKPVSGDQTGYEKFPAAPGEFTGHLRGNSLKDGFTNQ